MKTLTERRKADRIEMARQVRELVERLGATFTDEEPLSTRDRQICFEINHIGGARIGIDFDGDSNQPDVHVACWNVRSDSPACFSDAFGDINRYHFRKSQFVERGLDNLLYRLRCDLELLNSGEGYSPERTAAFAAEYPERFNRVTP